MIPLTVRLAAGTALLAALLGACSGKTASSGGGPDAGGACVNIDLSTYDQSCRQDSDCTLITPGEICPGDCSCGGATVNVSEEARYVAAVSGLQTGVCGCPAEESPRCIQNRCTLCGFGTTGACADAGGAPSCVTIDPTTYSTSCHVDTDCIDITSGTLCPGSCACGGTAVSASEQARYNAAVAGITSSACPCPSGGTPRCVQSGCVLCGPGGGPGCPDGG